MISGDPAHGDRWGGISPERPAPMRLARPTWPSWPNSEIGSGAIGQLAAWRRTGTFSPAVRPAGLPLVCATAGVASGDRVQRLLSAYGLFWRPFSVRVFCPGTPL
jgi:hypothetical protein